MSDIINIITMMETLFTRLLMEKVLDLLAVFFELFGNESSNSSNLNFDSGITYLIDDDKQLDLSIGRGLNSDMFYISAGFSIDIY